MAIKLSKAFSYFLIPFYYKGDRLSPGKIWIRDSSLLDEDENADFLYPHIMNFLKGNMRDKEANGSALQVFKLDEKTEEYKFFWKKFASKTHRVDIDNNRQIEFKFISGTQKPIFKTPHLFVSAEGNVAIFCFCLELIGDISLNNLKQLNYYLHKIQEPLSVCHANKMLLNDRLLDNAKVKVVEELNYAYRTLLQKNASEEELTSNMIWNMRHLTDFFLKGTCSFKKKGGIVESSSIELFSPPRIHLFSFGVIDDSENNLISLKDISSDLLKLSRCVNDKYMLPTEELEDEKAILKTFENIYMASSVEGTAMIAVAKKENKGFIMSMDQALERHQWVYMLALIQRYSLLNLERRITQIKSKDSSELLDILNRVSVLKTNCSYTEVSPFAQHNLFYRYCCQKLNINNSYEEIEHKTNILGLILDQKAEAGQRRLNLVVGLLTVFQVAEVIFTFTNKDSSQDLVAALSTIILGCIIIAFIFRNDIITYIKQLIR